MIGEMARQGAHHSAQKSTIAGVFDLSTTSSKLRVRHLEHCRHHSSLVLVRYAGSHAGSPPSTSAVAPRPRARRAPRRSPSSGSSAIDHDPATRRRVGKGLPARPPSGPPGTAPRQALLSARPGAAARRPPRAERPLASRPAGRSDARAAASALRRGSGTRRGRRGDAERRGRGAPAATSRQHSSPVRAAGTARVDARAARGYVGGSNLPDFLRFPFRSGGAGGKGGQRRVTRRLPRSTAPGCAPSRRGRAGARCAAPRRRRPIGRAASLREFLDGLPAGPRRRRSAGRGRGDGPRPGPRARPSSGASAPT